MLNVTDTVPGCDALVIGAGLVGCAVAWLLAARGVSVLVVERNTRPHAGASESAFGTFTPRTFADFSPEYLAFHSRSLQAYPDWLATLEDATGIQVKLRSLERLHVATGTAELHTLSQLVRDGKRLGFSAQACTEKEVRTMEPAVGPAVVAGVLLEKDGQVSSTEALCRAVFRAAVRAGATFRFGATAQALLWSHDRVCGVRLANGFAEATWTVLAAGPWTGQLLGNTKVCAITAQSSEALLVDGVARPLRILSSDRAYIAPRPDGQVMVGIEEVVDRFYSSSTLGGVGRVAANAIAVLPSLSLARLVQTWAAVRPYTFDHRPVIGPVEQADGLLVAAGHHYGIAQAPETARLIASIICDAPGERLEVPPDVLPGRGLVGQ